ncbi:MAG: DUF89 family protein [Deltaproteobacteria bacterium]|nr:DUF89 family protein [Deltaproteobacteria bacterium]
MRTFHDCLPCFVGQAVAALERCGVDDDTFETAMRAVFTELAGIDLNATPPATGRRLYGIIRRTTGRPDPYAAEKKHSNQLALDLLAELKPRLDRAPDGFLARLRLAVAGNSIDYGRYGRLDESRVVETLQAAWEAPLDRNEADALRSALRDAADVLYLCDNAGEIAFDRLLVEFLPHEHITCVVRGRPVLNDATLADAEQVGLTEVVEVIDNGSDAPGTLLEHCSETFRARFAAADLIVAKGQGNYETLSDVRGKRIFFLLQVKCPLIARDVGQPVGRLVVQGRPPFPT